MAEQHTLEDEILYLGLVIPPKVVSGITVVRHTNMHLHFKDPDGKLQVLQVATQNDIIFNDRYHSAN